MSTTPAPILEGFDLAEATKHAAIAILWSTSTYDEEGNFTGNLDDDDDALADIDPVDYARLSLDILGFVITNVADLRQVWHGKSNLYLAESFLYDNAQLGHDFALTRDGHGAGFWDRGLGVIGDRLTDAAKVYGSTGATRGDDGTIWLEGL